ncbi:MAG: hypothetical protein JNL08_08415 [Planctomycetes bacterium]|nr:hypothetical protein [Planctomycetota bacterium]
MRSAFRLGLTCGALAAGLAAQPGPVRRPTFALVRDAAGEPLAGAVVTFVGWLPHVGTAGPRDALVVAADARGRATAKLREGLCYVVWATRTAAAGCAVARPVGYFGAGAMLELRASAAAAPVAVPVEGLDAWREHGPLQLFAVTPEPGVEQQLELRDGTVVPPLQPRWLLEVRTGDGQPLWCSDPNPTRAVLPPPLSLPVRVVDEAGAPVAGARLVQRFGQRPAWGVDGFAATDDHRERQLGQVGTDGLGTVVVCGDGDLQKGDRARPLLLFASAPGRPAVACGRFAGMFWVDDRKVARPPADGLKFTLPREAPLVGSAGVVPAGTVAHLAAVCKLVSGQNSYYHDTRTFVVPVGPDGRVEFDGVPAELHSCHLTLLPPSGELGELPLLPALPGRALPLPAPSDDGTRPAPAAATLALQVVDDRGGPARGAIAFLAPATEGVLLRDGAVVLPVAGAGGLVTRLALGVWRVAVVTDTGWVAERFEITGGEHAERLALAPFPRMALRLLDAGGQPVAGAQVWPAGTRTVASGEPMQSLLVHLWHARTGWWRGLCTDADGRVEVPFLPIPGVTRRVRLGDGERTTAEFELVAGADPVTVRLR